MDVSLEQFKMNAIEHGICEMLQDWDSAKSKKQLMDVGLSVRGIEYVSRAIAEGWGVSPNVIANSFAPFLNGNYIRNANGYSSSMYCRPGFDKITISTTITQIIDFRGVVFIPKNRPCEIHIVNSEVEIFGDSQAVVYLYNSKINNPSIAPIIIKEDYEYGSV